MTVSIPLAAASSTAYWIRGLPATGSVSLSATLVAGSILVPSPAAGMTAFITVLRLDTGGLSFERSEEETRERELRAERTETGISIPLWEPERIPTSFRRF